MKCPKCNYPNPQAVTYCQMCYEVFNRSAADRYLHAQKRARMKETGATPETPSPSASPTPNPPPLSTEARILEETVSKIEWAAIFNRAAEKLKTFLRAYPKELGLGTAIIVLGVLVLFFTAAPQRLAFFGTHLMHGFPPDSTVKYLVSSHTELKSWSERSGRLDTPLETMEKDEMGNIDLIASNVKIKLSRSSSKQKVRQLVVTPREWIVNRTGGVIQNIPRSHPSLKPSQILLDRRGKILRQKTNLSTRMGRALGTVMPQWPSEAQRPGDQWNEPVQWVEALGDWKILWKGQLQWKIAGMAACEGGSCIHLTYDADVTPSLWEVPYWAKGAVRKVAFTGTGAGDVYFDARRHQVYSNDFIQQGQLSLPISNIYRIPDELRVGRTPRRRWGDTVSPEPGTLIMQMKEKFATHRS